MAAANRHAETPETIAGFSRLGFHIDRALGIRHMSTKAHQMQISDELKEVGLLKFELLASGVSVSPGARHYLEGAKRPTRTRSGASGGLDIVLPHDVHVNVPLHEKFASQSSLTLDCVLEKLVVRRGEDILAPVELQPIPQYYSLHTSDGFPMVKIGQMCSGDRFCYGMTGAYCWFWKRERRCKYCSIGLNQDRDTSQKTKQQMLEALARAVDDPCTPAKHVLIGGGTPKGEDMGAILASELCQAIKKHFELSCYVMISAPLKNEYIDMLHDAGADELGMNIEFYSDSAWEAIIPGKHRHIGKMRYLEALEYAASLFGSINTRSLLIVGLEDPIFTVEGAEKLASLGVMPILSPFRPLTGTEIEDRFGFDHLTYWRIYVEVLQRAAKYNIPVGPTCISCQNNVLALPIPNGQYRFY